MRNHWGVVAPVCRHRASVPVRLFPNPSLLTKLLIRTSVSHAPVVFASIPICHLLPPDRAAQLPVMERPGPVRMAHAQGGYLPGLLRPGPFTLDGGLFPFARLFGASRLARLTRGGAAGLTRRRCCRGVGVGRVAACSSTRWHRLREGMCGTQSRH